MNNSLMNTLSKLVIATLGAGILLASCKKDQEINPDTTPTVIDTTESATAFGRLELVVIPMVGEKALRLGDEYESKNQERFILKALSFFLSEIALNSSSGKETTLRSDMKSGIHLLDFSRPNFDAGYGQQSVLMRFQADTGRYSGLNLSLGVPRELNNSDPTVAPQPLDSAVIKGLYWGWDSGYIFMLADGEGQDIANNRFHLTFGKRQGTVGYTYGGFGPTRIRIEKDKTTRIVLSFDFNEVLTNANGSGYSLADPATAMVHGGANSLIIRDNTTKAFDFISLEMF